MKKHYCEHHLHLILKFINPFNLSSVFFYICFIQIGRKIMERSRPLDIKKKSNQIKHSNENQQEQLIRLLEN
jgi:predicted membrane protein